MVQTQPTSEGICRGRIVSEFREGGRASPASASRHITSAHLKPGGSPFGLWVDSGRWLRCAWLLLGVLFWDVSLAQPIPERFQGLLYLTDCSETDGAFHCVPGFHHRLPEWLDSLNPDDNARQLAAKTLQSKAVPGNAGDFVIWHQALPHCATPNRGITPRMVQYLTYIPTNDVEHSVWI